MDSYKRKAQERCDGINSPRLLLMSYGSGDGTSRSMVQLYYDALLSDFYYLKEGIRLDIEPDERVFSTILS